MGGGGAIAGGFSLPTGVTGGTVPDLAVALDATFGASSPAVDYLQQIATNTANLFPAISASPAVLASMGGGSGGGLAPNTIDASINGVVFNITGSGDPTATAQQVDARLATLLEDQTIRVEQALARRYDLYRAGSGNASRDAA